MKVRLLKKLRRRGRSKINVKAITTDSSGLVVGMRIGYDDNEYGNLFSLGDTEEDVLKKAEIVYLETNINAIRAKYRKINKKLISRLL